MQLRIYLFFVFKTYLQPVRLYLLTLFNLLLLKLS